jgi:hypothetical protein
LQQLAREFLFAEEPCGIEANTGARPLALVRRGDGLAF